jgi:hypothetical protein
VQVQLTLPVLRISKCSASSPPAAYRVHWLRTSDIFSSPLSRLTETIDATVAQIQCDSRHGWPACPLNAVWQAHHTLHLPASLLPSALISYQFSEYPWNWRLLSSLMLRRAVLRHVWLSEEITACTSTRQKSAQHRHDVQRIVLHKCLLSIPVQDKVNGKMHRDVSLFLAFALTMLWKWVDRRVWIREMCTL